MSSTSGKSVSKASVNSIVSFPIPWSNTSVTHREISVYPLTVQFEELDAGGIVHHPNYLRYCERARCDAMEARGYSFRSCMEDGATFVVAEALVRYLRPATLGDRLYVVSMNAGFRKSSLKVHQALVKTPPPVGALFTPGDVFRLPDALFHAQLRLVHVDVKTGRPLAMSDTVLSTFGLRQSLHDARATSSEGANGDVRVNPDWDSLP
jgi:acyl-CoA thioester hydrolase